MGLRGDTIHLAPRQKACRLTRLAANWIGWRPAALGRYEQLSITARTGRWPNGWSGQQKGRSARSSAGGTIETSPPEMGRSGHWRRAPWASAAPSIAAVWLDTPRKNLCRPSQGSHLARTLCISLGIEVDSARYTSEQTKI